MTIFSSEQRTTLALICETLIPPLEDDNPLVRAGAAPDLASEVEIALDRAASPTERAALRLFLTLIEIGAFNQLLINIPRAFSDMTPNQRADALRAWSRSRYALVRQIYHPIKRLALALHYSSPRGDQPNPTWAALGYPGGNKADGTPKPTAEPSAIQPITITGDTTLTADVLVIGSGAGGGVVAGELAAAGFDVLVVEKGAHFRDHDFHGAARERLGTEQMYERFGTLTTHDNAVGILAGSVLGGGTTINWAASLRTPDEVRREWARNYGFTAADTSDFTASLDAVCERLNVSTDECGVNGTNSVLERGANALGYNIKPIPRNVRGCDDCGFCNFGCAFGAKQSTVKTYLEDAARMGARIAVRADVERITHERGRVTGAILTMHDANGIPRRVEVRARIVVAAAGAIHTPALLIRSGLTNRQIGANLHLHPTTIIYGMFEQPIRGWQGVPMSRYTDQFANLDGKDYGVRLETPPVHPGIAATIIPWENAHQHKSILARLEQLAAIIVLTRDRDGGRVTVDAKGRPAIHYWLSAHDARHLQRGEIEAFRVYRAAGAVEIGGTYEPFTRWCAGEDFEAHLRALGEQTIKPNLYGVYSAHQMSSCRMGGSSALGALTPEGESYEVRGLFVADGSTLPTASGVNPMLSIMATAHHIAQGIKTRRL